MDSSTFWVAVTSAALAGLAAFEFPRVISVLADLLN